MKSVALYNQNLYSVKSIDQTTALFQTLQRIRDQQYADFPTDQGHNDVEDALEEMLHALGDPMKETAQMAASVSKKARGRSHHALFFKGESKQAYSSHFEVVVS